MASKSCLNNLSLSRDQRERLFDQFCATTDGPTRKQIMQQLFSMTPQETSQMQFMLDTNFSSTLTNLVLVRRDEYLRHAHPNPRCFQTEKSSLSRNIWWDLFDRAMMQEYEQHIIGLGVKTGTKKEHFPPYKKKGRGGHQRQHAQQGVFYQLMPAPQYMVQQPFFPHPQSGCRGECGSHRGRVRGGNTPNTKQQQPPQ